MIDSRDTRLESVSRRSLSEILLDRRPGPIAGRSRRAGEPSFVGDKAQKDDQAGKGPAAPSRVWQNDEIDQQTAAVERTTGGGTGCVQHSQRRWSPLPGIAASPRREQGQHDTHDTQQHHSGDVWGSGTVLG